MKPCTECGFGKGVVRFGARVLCGVCALAYMTPHRMFEAYCSPGVCGHEGHAPTDEDVDLMHAAWKAAA